MQHKYLPKILIAAAGTLLGGLFLTWLLEGPQWLAKPFTLFWMVLRLLWDTIVAEHQVSGWKLAILGLFALIGIGWLVAKAFLIPREADKLEWLNYTEDVIRGMKWRWRWTNQGTISNLCCFCLKCDGQLIWSGMLYDGEPGFFCEHCSSKVAMMHVDYLHPENTIKRVIQRKIRTNEYLGAPSGPR